MASMEMRPSTGAYIGRGAVINNGFQSKRLEESIMDIKVLGPGCKRCHETEKVVREAVAEAGIAASVEYITDIAEIAKHGIFSTPGVVVDGEVKSTGKIPSKAEVTSWLGK
jgi:small redox-active disulfide protein 2